MVQSRAITCIAAMYPRLQISDDARGSILTWGQHVGRHRWQHNLPQGVDASLLDLEEVEAVEMAIHSLTHHA